MDPKRMTCQESSGNLFARFRKELSPAVSNQLDGHLTGCATCREEEAEIASLQRMISSLPAVEPSPDSWSRLRMRIGKPAPAPSRKPAGRLVVLAAGLAAAVAAACLLILFPPSAPRTTLTAGPGGLSLNGAPVTPGRPVGIEPGAVLGAEGMSLATLSLSRSITVILAAGTKIEALPAGHLRLQEGRAFVEVAKGSAPFRFYAGGDTYVEVTGTAFDLSRNVGDPTATVAVANGEVQVWTGKSPVRVIPGQSLRFGPEPGSLAPSPVDPERIADWCRAPTILLTRDTDSLRITLRNDTVRPLGVQAFDPQKAVYSLSIEGPEIRLPVKIQERMVRTPSPPGREIRTLAPGESYDLLLDPETLALTRGTYRVRAVYKPYPPLPDDIWHGPPLKTEALTFTVE
jgi:ferric-dicitrate binding protein FerR (iron transport regulator)